MIIMKDRRARQVAQRKNFLPGLAVSAFFWIATFAVVFLVDPRHSWAVVLFFVFFTLAIFFAASLFFASSRRGLIASLVISIFALLRYFGVGNALNFFLLVGVGIAFDFFFGYH